MKTFWSLPDLKVVDGFTTTAAPFDEAQLRRYENGGTVSDPDSLPGRTFVVASGLLKVTKLLASGREILITILQPGAMFSDRAVLNGYWREVFVEALTPAEVLSIENDRFERTLRGDQLRFATFMMRVSEQVSDALTLLDDFRGRDVSSRLASVLLRFSKQYGVKTTEDTVIIELPFTHQDLANMIGTARETVSRNMARLRASGYVRDSVTGSLEILDLERLEDLCA